MLNLWILLYAVVVLTSVGVLWSRNDGDLFHPIPLFLIYLFIQIGASNVLYSAFGISGELSLPLPEFEGAYVRATWMGILATALTFLGSLLARNRALGLGKEGGISTFRLGVLTLAAFAGGVLACITLFDVNGGLAEFLVSREEWRTTGMIGQGVLTFPATVVLNLVALIHLGHAFAQRQSRPRKVVAFVLLGLSVTPAILFGFRSAILLPLLQATLIVNYAGIRIRPLHLAVGAVLVLLLFTAYGAYREIAPRSDLSIDAALQLAPEKPELALAAISRSRGADVVANVVTRLDVRPDFDWGPQSLLDLMTIWIPTQLWPSKPVATTMRFTTYFFGAALADTRQDYRGYYSGISPTFIGETYWHLGYPGLIIFAIAWGYLGQVMFNTAKGNRSRTAFLVFYAIVWTSFVMSAESIQGYANILLLSAGALVVMLILIRRQADSWAT